MINLFKLYIYWGSTRLGSLSRNTICNVANFVLSHIKGFDVELGVVSSRCNADKETSIADGAAVEVLFFYKIEDVVSVMFLLAVVGNFWFVTHVAAADQLLILSQNDFWCL